MFDRIVLVTKRTALEELLVRHHSRGQAAFFLERRGTTIDEFDRNHAAERSAIEVVAGAIPREVPRETVPRHLLPNFLFRERDLVIVVGPDGLVVNVAKYLDGQPILGVNADASRNDGVLVRFAPDVAGRALPAILRSEFRADTITLAEVRTNDGQALLAVNDFLVGRRDQVSARYTITHRGRMERQSSSGVLIATGVGSTGWMRAAVTGAQAIVAGASKVAIPFAWDTPQLLFVVREPFPSKATGATITTGVIRKGEELVIASEMPEGGAIFADGVVEDAIEFNAGTTVRIGIAPKTAQLIRL
ncbi:MAG: sugar kinase [Candidatus Uhrbacteria bacterium]